MRAPSFLPWYPWFGCSAISPSCGDCHAIPQRFSEAGELDGVVALTDDGPVFNGKLRFNENQIDFPNSLKAASIILVLPHGDLFHENAPDAWLDRVFDVMDGDLRHIYQISTKRSERMRDYMQARYPLAPAPPHIAVGVSVEGQTEADRRIPDLLATPALSKWLIVFALHEPIDMYSVPNLDECTVRSICQVMIGGTIKGDPADPIWYDDVRRFFELSRVPVTSHVVPEEVAKWGF